MSDWLKTLTVAVLWRLASGVVGRGAARADGLVVVVLGVVVVLLGLGVGRFGDADLGPTRAGHLARAGRLRPPEGGLGEFGAGVGGDGTRRGGRLQGLAEGDRVLLRQLRSLAVAQDLGALQGEARDALTGGVLHRLAAVVGRDVDAELGAARHGLWGAGFGPLLAVLWPGAVEVVAAGAQVVVALTARRDARALV